MLSDADRRRQYDTYGHEGLRSGGYAPNFEGFGSVSDLFAAFFGSGGFDTAFGAGRGQRAGQMQGGDVVVAVAVELAGAARGERVEVQYEADVRCERCHGNGAEPGTPIITCTRCHGSGQLQAVSPGTGASGSCPHGDLRRVRRRGARAGAAVHDMRGQRPRARVAHDQSTSRRGSPTASGSASPAAATRASAAGPTGTSTSSRVPEDERFVRDQEDLHTVIDVPAPLAALGTTVQVPSLDGEIPVEVPAGTQPGEIITLRARGMPPLQRGRTGDLHVHVNVVIPRKLTRSQRELFEQLAELDDRRQPQQRRGDAVQAQARPVGMTDRPTSSGSTGDRAPVVRLGIRVRRERAEIALAALLPILGAGAEETELDDGSVEYALYAPRAELPTIADLREMAGDAVIDVALTDVAPGWERRWHEYLQAHELGSAERRVRVRPPGRPPRIDPACSTSSSIRRRSSAQAVIRPRSSASSCCWTPNRRDRCATGGSGSGVLAVAAARLECPGRGDRGDARRPRGDQAQRGGQRCAGAHALEQPGGDAGPVGADRHREPDPRLARHHRGRGVGATARPPAGLRAS